MKDRLADDNDENETVEVKPQKPVVTAEKYPPAKATKPNKPTSNSLTLKQALQNVNLKILQKMNFLSISLF
jgi:hypothetical protein